MDTAWKICTSKDYQFKTKAKAKKHLRHKAFKKGRSRRYGVYKCPACGQWHMTHYTANEQKFISKQIEALKELERNEQ